MATIGSISGHQVRYWASVPAQYILDTGEVSGTWYDGLQKAPVLPVIEAISGVSKFGPPVDSGSLTATAKPNTNTIVNYLMVTPFQSAVDGATLRWGDGYLETIPANGFFNHVYNGPVIVEASLTSSNIVLPGTTSFLGVNWTSINQWGNTTSIDCQGMTSLASLPAAAPTLLSGPFWRENVFNGCTSFNHTFDASYFALGVDASLYQMFRNTAVDQDFGSIDLSGVTDMREMFDGAAMSSANISATLVGWDDPTTNTGVNATNVFGAVSISESAYPAGKVAYDNLVLATGSGGKGWTLTGITWTA